MGSELTLLVLRLAFLAALWIFVFSVVYALRSDIFGTRASEYQKQKSREESLQQAFAAAPAGAASAAAPGHGAPASPAAPPSSPSARPAASPSTRLIITTGPQRGRELDLGVGPITIGRSKASTLVIEDDYTSTNHARLVLQGETWWVHDLDSTNGTYVNGQRIAEPTRIPRGASVRIGTTTFELR